MKADLVFLEDLKEVLMRYLAAPLVTDIIEDMEGQKTIIHSTVITDEGEANAYIEKLSDELGKAREKIHKIEEKLFENRRNPDPTLFDIYYGYRLLKKGDLVKAKGHARGARRDNVWTRKVVDSYIDEAGSPFIWIEKIGRPQAMDRYDLVEEAHDE
jgi:hypothetical protein